MDKDMHYGDDYRFIPVTSMASGVGQAVTPDLFCLPIQVVNVCMVGDPEQSDDWVLVDAGMPKSADNIISICEKRFGKNNPPSAIILTHGHFDHVGGIIELMQHWNMPVYAHKKEIPYLTGELDYPDPDGHVEGGLVAKMSPFFPNEAVNLGELVHALPEDGHVPGMSGWKWIHTPGHTPGHISLFRDSDRSLIVGDAFITVRQDSLFKVFAQEKEINGPPRYFTTDWQTAWDSVKRLESLNPSLAITGHGFPMSGDELSEGLQNLAQDFGHTAIPDHGRFVDGHQEH